jgi:hypothetical protein
MTETRAAKRRKLETDQTEHQPESSSMRRGSSSKQGKQTVAMWEEAKRRRMESEEPSHEDSILKLQAELEQLQTGSGMQLQHELEQGIDHLLSENIKSKQTKQIIEEIKERKTEIDELKEERRKKRNTMTEKQYRANSEIYSSEIGKRWKMIGKLEEELELRYFGGKDEPSSERESEANVIDIPEQTSDKDKQRATGQGKIEQAVSSQDDGSDVDQIELDRGYKIVQNIPQKYLDAFASLSPRKDAYRALHDAAILILLHLDLTDNPQSKKVEKGEASKAALKLKNTLDKMNFKYKPNSIIKDAKNEINKIYNSTT